MGINNTLHPYLYFWICSLAVVPCLAVASDRPNIILINIDDLGWTDMSNNGSQYYETPNIDRLREKGIWMNEAYAGAANSAPSRACLLTGRYTPRHGIYTVGEPNRGDAGKRKLVAIPNRTSLEPGIRLLPEVLKDFGYQTCHIGKWHVTENPLLNGVDINIAGNHAGHPKSYFSPYYNEDLTDGPEGEYLMDRLGLEAVDYLRKVDKSKPFFLYYATYAVHTPLQAKADLIDKYRKKPSTSAHDNPVYAAMVENMDWNIGRVLDEVQALGIEENTFIVFTSDNGGVYGISRQWPLRAGKGSFYEGGIRIPMVIYQKGKYEKREICNIPVMQLDLFPTFLEIAGVRQSDLLLDGVSLLPLLAGNETGFKGRPLFWHFPAYLEGNEKETVETGNDGFRTRPVSVIRVDDWKLIENYETGNVELYNVWTDVSEKENLALLNKDKRDELFDWLQVWKQKVEAPIPTMLNPEYECSFFETKFAE